MQNTKLDLSQLFDLLRGHGISRRAKHAVQHLLHPFDLMLISPQEHQLYRLQRILTENGIDLVLDVGAHTGEYAALLRRLGYSGRIVSFEPASAAFAELARKSRMNLSWEAINIALSEYDGQADINIADRPTRSSLLEKATSDFARSNIHFVDTESVTVRRLDSVIDLYWHDAKSVLLKLDVQGYERQVLNGATNTLKLVTALQLEIALTERYQGETLLCAMLDDMHAKGFELALLKPGKSDANTGLLVQVDGVFLRRA